MSFHGRETAAPEQKQLRKYTYKDFGGRLHTVEAHYVNFMPEHVTFWWDVPGQQDRLVLAVANRQVHDLKELTGD